MKKTLLFPILLICSLAQAQEVIVSYNNSTIPVLNEELRKSRNDIRQNTSSISDLVTDMVMINAKFPVSIANGGTGSITQQTAIDALTVPTAGTPDQVWTTDGTHGSWQNGSVPTYYASSTEEIGIAATERNGTDATYTKKKEITFVGNGELTISFELKNTDTHPGCDTSYGRIYRNGVAVGTERTIGGCSDTYSTFTETISGWSNGDKIQLYCKANGNYYYVKNFIVYGTTLQVNTD